MADLIVDLARGALAPALTGAGAGKGAETRLACGDRCLPPDSRSRSLIKSNGSPNSLCSSSTNWPLPCGSGNNGSTVSPSTPTFLFHAFALRSSLDPRPSSRQYTPCDSYRLPSAPQHGLGSV